MNEYIIDLTTKNWKYENENVFVQELISLAEHHNFPSTVRASMSYRVAAYFGSAYFWTPIKDYPDAAQITIGFLCLCCNLDRTLPPRCIKLSWEDDRQFTQNLTLNLILD